MEYADRYEGNRHHARERGLRYLEDRMRERSAAHVADGEGR
ncbi:hypothetical protein [Streptomyces zaomyceticus]